MGNKLRVYLDTSVFGGLVDSGPESRVTSTIMLFDKIKHHKIDGVISDVLLEELNRAPLNLRKVFEYHLKGLAVLQEDQESEALAQLYMESGVFPLKSFTDARHVAIAVTNNIHTIISWNFHHLVNLARKRYINSTNLIAGYPMIEIISPLEVEYDIEKND